MKTFDRSKFEEAKRRSFLQVLFKAARLANEDAIARIRERMGHSELRLAHTAIFPHVPHDGIRLTDLAELLGVTKQATQQLVDELEEMGLLERVRDPSDGRAKLIRWSDSGRDGMSRGVAFLVELESRYRDLVGDDRLESAHQVLSEIVDLLDASDRGDGSS